MAISNEDASKAFKTLLNFGSEKANQGLKLAKKKVNEAVEQYKQAKKDHEVINADDEAFDFMETMKDFVDRVIISDYLTLSENEVEQGIKQHPYLKEIIEANAEYVGNDQVIFDYDAAYNIVDAEVDFAASELIAKMHAFVNNKDHDWQLFTVERPVFLRLVANHPKLEKFTSLVDGQEFSFSYNTVNEILQMIVDDSTEDSTEEAVATDAFVLDADLKQSELLTPMVRRIESYVLKHVFEDVVIESFVPNVLDTDIFYKSPNGEKVKDVKLYTVRINVLNSYTTLNLAVQIIETDHGDVKQVIPVESNLIASLSDGDYSTKDTDLLDVESLMKLPLVKGDWYFAEV